jgi:hypothetical protein
MRVIKTIAGAVAIFVVAGGLFLWWTRRPHERPANTPATGNNRFETWHARREVKNPPELTMTLDTADGKRTYPESKHIPLVIKYSGSISRMYIIEIGVGMNAESQSQMLHADGIRSLTYLPG